MFASLSDNLAKIFDKLKGKGFLTEDDVNTAMREIRIALLEADVALPVVKEFIEIVRAKAIGVEVLKSITPSQLIVKIVNDELKNALGGEEVPTLNTSTKPPAVIMLVGLQGSGKTTTAAKIALWLRQKSKKQVLMASLDVYRPAAQEQLEILGKQISIATLPIVPKQDPVEITKRAIKEAELSGVDVLILDTAGRLHTDDELIKELQDIKRVANPIETILVADSLTGQDAVNISKYFNEKIELTGVILTRVDGDARGGAALSIKQVTGCPIKFIGIGEKPSDFEAFYPERIASRILGMGDVVSLVEKASEAISKEDAEKLANKIQKGKFDFEDLLDQLRNLKKMGGVGKLVSLIPGISKIKNQLSAAGFDEKMLKKQEAIILSMTIKERRNPELLNASRKKRIASGSGNKVEDVNRLLKQYLTMSKMMKKFGKMSPDDLKKMERMLNV
jgi:signal recognition particle subunit SRP54